MKHMLLRLTVAPIIRLFIKRVDGKENLLKKGPFIIASNHSSFLDDGILPSIIIPIYNQQIHFYVHSNYFKYYILRKILESGECIPVDLTKGKDYKETNKKAFQTALGYLKKDGILAIFPEGTRSFDGKLQKTKTGIAKLATTAKVPIIPIGIIGSHKVLPKGKSFPRFVRCRVKIGKPIYLKEYYKNNSNKKILKKVTRIIMKEIAKLIGQKYNY